MYIRSEMMGCQIKSARTMEMRTHTHTHTNSYLTTIQKSVQSVSDHVNGRKEDLKRNFKMYAVFP